MNASNTTDKVLSLRDGRVLCYAEYGDPSGKPFFFFHGLPGSRRQRHPDNSIASEIGARIIAIDRPGYGLSDFQPGRKLLDWPGDVAQLADCLKIEQFSAIGVSGGGPYLLACAYKMPERMDDEWHLHVFDLAGLLAMIPRGLRVTRVEGIPFRWLPLRYVVRCESNPREG